MPGALIFGDSLNHKKIIMSSQLQKSVSGVRGIVGDSLTVTNMLTFAQAFGTLMGPGTIIVGRDTRISGRMIEHVILAGLQSVGCQPLLAGIVPTPTALIATQKEQAAGGIIITASHNPVSWNALKFVEGAGLFLNQKRFEQLLTIYEKGEFPHVRESDLKQSKDISTTITQEHFDRVLQYVNTDAIRKKRLKVAVDCCNGVGALHTPRFLREALGCEVITLFDQPSGRFEREPEPTPASLKHLGETVVKHGCALGFAQDPDGDRLALVDEHGRAIGEDLTLAFAVEQVLARHAKGPVAVNLSTSKSIEFVAQKHGCKVTRTKIGEINVTETMLAQGAVVGGEGNGGVIIPEVHPCRDSYTGMAVILELLVDTGKSISELCAEIPSYHFIKDKRELEGIEASDILQRIGSHYSRHKVNTLDGVHVDFGDSWLQVRASNTEPILRVTSEAPNKVKAQELSKELHDLIDAHLSSL